MSRRTKGLYLLVTVLTIGAAVATFFSLDKALERSNVEVKDSIDKSVQTKVESDAMGAHHLLDKVSGEELTVRSDGDTFVTTPRFDALTSRKLNCLAISDVAKIVNDAATATPASLVIKDQDGVEKEIIPIGNYKDDETVLEFGSFRVIMDSDACNSALGEPTVIDIAPALDATDEEDEGLNDGADNDANENDDASDEEEGSDIFKRQLRKPSPSIKSSPTSSSRAVANVITPSKQSTVLARHRQEFAMSRLAIKEGRHLTSDNFVPVHAGSNDADALFQQNYSLSTGKCRAVSGLAVDYFGGSSLYSANDGISQVLFACYNYCGPYMGAPGYTGIQFTVDSSSALFGRCWCFFDDGFIPSDRPAGSFSKYSHAGKGPVTGTGMVGFQCASYRHYSAVSFLICICFHSRRSHQLTPRVSIGPPHCREVF